MLTSTNAVAACENPYLLKNLNLLLQHVRLLLNYAEIK